MTGEGDKESSEGDATDRRWPIGFMLLLGAVALYLGWRLVQGVGALIGWIAG